MRTVRTLVAALLLVALAASVPARGATPPSSGLSTYAGLDLPDPGKSFTHCSTDWTWLTPSCYTDTTGSSGVSIQGTLASDIAFIKAQHLGRFQRLWVSLDQLMAGFDATTGYSAYSSQALANLDDALGQYAAAGMTVDLVLYTNSNTNGFHAEALDGNHEVMRAGYLLAITDLMTHIKNNAQDSKAVVVADLMNEGYLQLEGYYNTANIATHMGKWAFSEDPGGTNACEAIGNVICDRAHNGSDGHGCENQGHTAVVTTCVDVNILLPFFQGEYNAAHAADPAVKYTVSDTLRLLTTSVSQFSSQAWEKQLYAFADIYDIHLYAGTTIAGYADGPWSAANTAKYLTALALDKAWFAGEAGCGAGNTACTYDGSVGLAVDAFWLANAWGWGAQAICIESNLTVWTYPTATGGVLTHALTLVGKQVAFANGGGARSRSRVRPRGR